MRGTTAIITGAARGIGRACALRLAGEGADLVLIDVDNDLPEVGYPLGTPDQLESSAARCRALGAAVETLLGNVAEARTAEAAAAVARDRFGRADSLVNCAGIAGPAGKAVYDMTEAEWSLMIGVNLTGPWQMIRAVAPLMVHQRSGSIVNVSSTAGLVGYRYFAGYVAAKHGLVGLTKAAALDLAPYGVRVNAVCPGSVRDDPELDGRMLGGIAESLGIALHEHEAVFRQQQPMNTLVEAHDVADAVAWLVAPGSARTTGSTVVVDAGFAAR